MPLGEMCFLTLQAGYGCWCRLAVSSMSDDEKKPLATTVTVPSLVPMPPEVPVLEVALVALGGKASNARGSVGGLDWGLKDHQHSTPRARGGLCEKNLRP